MAVGLVQETPAGVQESTLRRWTTFLLSVLSNVFCGLVATLLATYLPVIVRDLVGTMDDVAVGEIGAYVGSLFLIGWTAGGIAFGWAGDRFGRAKAFTVAVALFGGATLASVWVEDWLVLMVYRFLAGAGVGGTMVVSAILVAEIWPPGSRAIALGMLGVAFPIGIVSAGAINYVLPDWRSAFLIGLLPLAVGFASFFSAHDSATWAASNAQRRSGSNPFQLLVAPEIRKNFAVGAAVFGVMSVGLWAAFSWLPTWAQSILPPDASGQKERGLLMMLLGMGGIVGTAVSGFISNAIGRKKTLLLAFAGCFVASFILFKTNAVFSSVVFVETALLAIFFGIGQGVLMVYIPELFPTLVRSTATGICFNVGRIVTAIAVFFVGVLVPVLGGYGNAVFAFAFMYVVGLVVAVFGPETKGKLL
ncbi:MAG TPA: MFS transporter [Rhodothermales bacterium]|nr:MFS transporter [Rhodothermales bacterium]